jgi:hypothetical protein
MKKNALLLNADWRSLYFIDEVTAVNLIYLNKAEPIIMENGLPSLWNPGHKLVNGFEFPAAATLRLLNYVNFKYQLKFQKKLLFARDNYECQYCRKKLTTHSATVDHVLPTSKGGITSWINCVTACNSCNTKKGNKLLNNCNLTLLNQPKFPDQKQLLYNTYNGEFHPDWKLFL